MSERKIVAEFKSIRKARCKTYSNKKNKIIKKKWYFSLTYGIQHLFVI